VSPERVERRLVAILAADGAGNLSTARTLAVTIPLSLLAIADEVIE
jgi:hypothetical protein